MQPFYGRLTVTFRIACFCRGSFERLAKWVGDRMAS